MTTAEINALQREILVIQSQMDQHVVTVQDIADGIKAGKGTLDPKAAAIYHAEITRQGQGFQDYAERGVAVYGKLKAAGSGTKELDDWCDKIRKLST